MAAKYELTNVLSFFQGGSKPVDWSNQELANFYKVEHILLQNGVLIDVDRGTTDEGDPWFVFCYRDGDVFLHFARVRGGYLAAGPHIAHPVWSKDFTELLRLLQDRVPFILPGNSGNGATVLMHPSVLLIAAVAAYFYQSATTKADEQAAYGAALTRTNESRVASSSANTDFQAAALIAAIAFIAGTEGLDSGRGMSLAELPSAHTINQSDSNIALLELDESFVATSESQPESVPASDEALDTASSSSEGGIDDIVIAASSVELEVMENYAPATSFSSQMSDEYPASPPAILESPSLTDAQGNLLIAIQGEPVQLPPDAKLNEESLSNGRELSSADLEQSSVTVREREEPDSDDSGADVAEGDEVSNDGGDETEAPQEVEAAKYIITQINGIFVLIENNDFNFPNGLADDVAALEGAGDEAAGIEDVAIVGSSVGEDAYSMM